MALPSVQEMESYIRQAAQARGIDPDVAVRVARSEGLAPNTWQANGMLSYGREQSYGPFQLHVDPTGKNPGMGNAFKASTGLDPSDPSTWKQGVDFALDQAAQGGWSPWFGAKKIGITGMMGIDGGKAMGVSPPAYSAGPGRGSMAGYQTPGTYSGGEFVPGTERTFYADNSPALPGNQGQGVGAALGGFSGGPSQVAARNPMIQTASVKGTGDFRPTNFQRMEARKAMEGDQSQKARLLQAAGLDPTGKTRLMPRGASTEAAGGILGKLGGNLDDKLSSLPSELQKGLQGGILGKLFNLFG